MTLTFRISHDVEYQNVWRVNVPEVFHFDQDAPTPVTKAWQKFIVALNVGITGNGYRSLLKYDRAFTNYTGYDWPDHPPRADFINNRNLLAKLPVIDKVRVCGGAIIHGELVDGLITVETLNGLLPPPSVSYVLARPWLYFKALIVRSDGSTINFPQNLGKPVYFPLVATGKVTVKYNTIVPNKPYPYVKLVR